MLESVSNEEPHGYSKLDMAAAWRIQNFDLWASYADYRTALAFGVFQ